MRRRWRASCSATSRTPGREEDVEAAVGGDAVEEEGAAAAGEEGSPTDEGCIGKTWRSSASRRADKRCTASYRHSEGSVVRAFNPHGRSASCGSPEEGGSDARRSKSARMPSRIPSAFVTTLHARSTDRSPCIVARMLSDRTRRLSISKVPFAVRPAVASRQSCDIAPRGGGGSREGPQAKPFSFPSVPPCWVCALPPPPCWVCALPPPVVVCCVLPRRLRICALSCERMRSPRKPRRGGGRGAATSGPSGDATFVVLPPTEALVAPRGVRAVPGDARVARATLHRRHRQ